MTVEEYRTEIVRRLSPYRAQHSLNVAEEAVRLALQYGEDVSRAEIAGLLHDCTKETPQKEQLQLLKQFDIILRYTEQCGPKLLHAMTGPIVAREQFGVTDSLVLDAIRYHTTGRAGMSQLEKIIYIADFVSADRTYSGVDELRALAYRNLDDAVLFALSYTISDLVKKQRPVHEDTVNAYNEQMCARLAAQQGDSIE